MNFEKLLGLLATIVLLGVISWAIFTLIQNAHECKDRGGQMVGTGEYTTIFVKSGSVNVPIRLEKQVCVVPEK